MTPQRWRRVKNIFDAALDAAPEGRESLLAEACAGDPALREDVTHLLESFDRSDSFIETTAVAENLGLFDGPAPAISEGDQIGHYRIDKQIGSGGMGEVYLATDEKLGRRVAIKILREEFARHEDNVRRFLREAKAASSLNHPNILVIHEISIGDETNYIVSEFVEGETLRQRLGGKPLNLAEVLDITIQVAEALNTAHGASIVHRDIKPENIALRPDGYVKVLDFGLAKLVEKREDFLQSDGNQTAKGIIMGTVNYMSPEQAKGNEVDERTDVFSLGVVLYEMIAGVTPFRGDTKSETFANLINAEPQPLSRHAPNIVGELERIVSNALSKEPGARYQTMKDLLTDLKGLRKQLEFENGYNGNARRDTVTGIFASGELPELLRPDRNSIAVLPFTNIGADVENEYFCDGLAEELLNALAKIKDLKVAARTSAFSFKGKNTTVSEIGNALNVRTVLEGSVRRSGDRLRITAKLINAEDGYQLWSERFDGEMRDIFKLQDEITLVVIDKLKVNFLSKEKAAVLKRMTENPEAYQLYAKGKLHSSRLVLPEVQKGIAYFEQAIAVDPGYAPAYVELANAYTPMVLTNDARPSDVMPKAKAAARKAIELDDALAEAHTALAVTTFWYDFDPGEAEKQHRRALELDPRSSQSRFAYAHFLSNTGRHDEALVEIRRARELDPISLVTNAIEGQILFFAGEDDEALKSLQATAEMDSNFWLTSLFMTRIYMKRGSWDEAIAAATKARDLSHGNSEAIASIGSAQAKAGKTADARVILRDLEERAKVRYVPSCTLAQLYLALGEKEKALDLLEISFTNRAAIMAFLKVDPGWDALRSEPRFVGLMQKMNLG
ncbi:MAG: hypothetical protein DMF63_07165 [Acidobacteria bacterium]|nr:MAG: hypothetical protein DMF63_07165 [Acidobacteriota bacterium]